jgi:glycosyltransferase involved in cell wall biosynthesis
MVAPANNPHTMRFAESLLETGYELKIVSWAEGEIDGVEVYVHSQVEPEVSGIRKKIEHFKDYAEIRKRLQWADVVFVNFIYNWRFNEIYRGLDNIVVLLWGSDIVMNENETPVQKKYKKLILSLAKKVLAFSNWLAREAEEYLPEGVKAEVLPVGIRLDRFYPRDKKYGSTRPVIIGYAKGLDKKYGAEDLIRACEILKDENLYFRCRIAGSGDLEIYLKNLVEVLGLGEYIDFMGKIPHDKIPDFMRDLDIFVMPSVCRESFGVAALEASASEVPVVASRIGGIPEVVWDDETGYLVTPANPMELAETLKVLVESEDLRFCMGQQGRDFVKSNFRWENTVKRLDEVFREIAQV